MPLDIKKMALVGANSPIKARASDRVERRCEGCRRHVYLTGACIRDTLQRAGDSGVCVVCHACAKPWLVDIVRNGGGVAGSERVLEDDVFPVLEQIRQDEISAN